MAQMLRETPGALSILLQASTSLPSRSAALRERGIAGTKAGYVYLCIHIYICTYIFIYKHKYRFEYMYVCMYIYIIYKYTHTRVRIIRRTACVEGMPRGLQTSLNAFLEGLP